MGRQQTAIKNSTVGLLSQIISLAIQFLTRSIFIQYLGVEMLGISSTFASILNTLSLTELGFQAAIVYSLYRPLIENDYHQVNEIMNVLKSIYRFIGCFLIFGGFVCCPFLKFILSGVEVSKTIYLIFLIQVSNSACTYFLAYKRALFHADGKGYINQAIDTVTNIVFSLLKIFVVIKTSNYVYFVTLTTLQTIISNLFINIAIHKKYSFLRKTKFNVGIFKGVWENVKHLFVSKIAFYIYSSTDNIIISTVLGAVSVGYLVNYTTIINSIKTFTGSVLSPITPIIGKMLAEEKDAEKNEKIFRSYTYIRYVIACATIIPIIVLAQSFISAWIGEQYLLSDLIVWLYGMDLYIHLVHTSLCDFINGSGLFKADRNIEIVGAVSNLAVSLVLVYVFGITGVLIGTIVSQGAFWILRSIVVYKNCFRDVKKGFAKYWATNAAYIVLFLIMGILLTMVYQKIKISSFIIRFIVGGILCEIIILLVHIIIFGRTDEYKQMKGMAMNILNKLIKRNK